MVKMEIKTELLYLLRVLLAAGLGFVVGIERKMRYKEAGMRTHAIVAAGAALLTLISKYGFTDSGTGDGARVAAQIVTGIGFLGAGVIMYRRDSLRGITTAAGIWTTAGVGMAAGAGLYILAAGTTVLVVFIQYVLHLRIKFFKTKVFYLYRIKFKSADGENDKIKSFFGVRQFSRINYFSGENEISATAEISTNRTFSDDEIKNLVSENPFITSIERIYQLDAGD